MLILGLDVQSFDFDSRDGLVGVAIDAEVGVGVVDAVDLNSQLQPESPSEHAQAGAEAYEEEGEEEIAEKVQRQF